jgi:hypothetical protein
MKKFEKKNKETVIQQLINGLIFGERDNSRDTFEKIKMTTCVFLITNKTIVLAIQLPTGFLAHGAK